MTRRWTAAACLSAAACGSPAQPTERSGWSTPIAIADVTRRSEVASFSRVSCVAGTGDGAALVFWVRREADADEIRARALSAGDDLGPEEPVQDDQRLPRVNDLRCATDETGEGYASWIEFSGRQVRVVARRITPAGLDATTVPLDAFDASSFWGSSPQHDLAVSGGRALAVWRSPEGLRAATATDGLWTHAGLVTNASVFPLGIGVDLRGRRGAVVYVQSGRRDNGSVHEAWVRLLDDAGRFGPPVWLGWGRWINYVEPVIDEAGHVMVASLHMTYAQLLTISRWRGADWSTETTDAMGAANGGLLFSGAPDGSAVALRSSEHGPLLDAARWAPGEVVPAIETVSDAAPEARGHTLTIDAATGAVHAAWVAEGRPWLASSTRPGEWQAAVVPGARRPPPVCPAESPGSGASEPRLVLDGRGGLLAAWIEGECGTASLRVQRRRAP
ncbi:MAG: hypothetical protein ABW221_18580 [Vicinamibacteria bacterium]